MPILSVKRIINAPNVTSTLPGLWPVQLKPFAPLPVSLMSPVCPSIPVLLGPLMLESRKLRYLFCQVELFSCRHWQIELFFHLLCGDFVTRFFSRLRSLPRVYFIVKSVAFNPTPSAHSVAVRRILIPPHEQLLGWWQIICAQPAFSCQH